jgi:hypothetical protein
VSPEIVIPVVGGVLGSILLFLGAWNTSRVAKYSNDRTASLEEFKIQLKARDDLIAQYKEDVKTLALKVDTLTERMDKLQQNERVLFWWAKTVYPILKSTGLTFPYPPPGISDTNPRMDRVQ